MTRGTVHGYQQKLVVIVHLTFLVRHIEDSLYATFIEAFAPKRGIHTNPFELN